MTLTGEPGPPQRAVKQGAIRPGPALHFFVGSPGTELEFAL